MFRLVQDCTCHILLCKRFYLMYEYRCFGIVFPPKAYAYKAFHIKHLIRNGEQDSSTLTILHLTTIPKTIKQSYIIVTAASEILRCMLTIGNVSNSLQHRPNTYQCRFLIILPLSQSGLKLINHDTFSMYHDL